MQKKTVRIFCLILAGWMLLTAAVPVFFAYADDETPAEKLERLRAELAELEAQGKQLESSRSEAEQTRQYYLSLTNNLRAQLAELTAREQELTETQAAYEAAIQNAERQIGAADAQIAALAEEQAAKSEEEKQAEQEWLEWVSRPQQVDFEYNEGGFIWPIPGYTRLSSDFGWRTLEGKADNHRGLDIGAPLGTPIYAAADGIVSTNNHSSYGISVKLSHGSGLATIYGHMSSRVVNDGDRVTQGQLIGYVGKTGHAYGYHLHFEANLNGQPVDPRNYLG